MIPVISSFSGQWWDLSNFGPSPTEFKVRRGFGIGANDKTLIAPTNEHAFHASKTFDADEQEAILLAPTPGEAKALGRKCTLRPDWEAVKVGIMYQLLRKKFNITTHTDLALVLLRTDNAILIEGNTWGDDTWGACANGKQGPYWGETDLKGWNWLGTLLMLIRSELTIP